MPRPEDIYVFSGMKQRVLALQANLSKRGAVSRREMTEIGQYMAGAFGFFR